MAVDYSFYVNNYGGDSITADEFDRIALRVQAVLDKYKRIWTVKEPTEDAEEMALCAMADAFYFYEAKQNEYQSSSIGSVSSSKGGMDISTQAQDREMYKCASLYLDIYKGVGKW